MKSNTYEESIRYTTASIAKKEMCGRINKAVMSCPDYYRLDVVDSNALMKQFNAGTLILPCNTTINETLSWHDRRISDDTHKKQGAMRKADAWWNHGTYDAFVAYVGAWTKHISSKSSAKFYAKNKATINTKRRAAYAAARRAK